MLTDRKMERTLKGSQATIF